MTHINVINRIQRVEIDPVNQAVKIGSPTRSIIIHNVGPPGPPGLSGSLGPPGPQGPPGPDTSSMIFTQVSASDEWIINHNFGFYPIVNCFTVGGNVMLGQIVNMTINQVRVFFSNPVAGTARLT